MEVSCREQGAVQGSQEGLCLSSGAKKDALSGARAVRSTLPRMTVAAVKVGMGQEAWHVESCEQ